MTKIGTIPFQLGQLPSPKGIMYIGTKGSLLLATTKRPTLWPSLVMLILTVVTSNQPSLSLQSRM